MCQIWSLENTCIPFELIFSTSKKLLHGLWRPPIFISSHLSLWLKNYIFINTCTLTTKSRLPIFSIDQLVRLMVSFQLVFCSRKLVAIATTKLRPSKSKRICNGIIKFIVGAWMVGLSMARVSSNIRYMEYSVRVCVCLWIYIIFTKSSW